MFAPGSPTSQQVDCATLAPIGEPLVTDTAGKSALSYAVSGQYSYIWKTEKAWAGTCRVLSLRLADGTEHPAAFQFK